MRIYTPPQVTAQVAEVKIDQGQLVLAGTFSLQCPLPEQNEYLPHRLEETIDQAGQTIKRHLFQQALEKADVELLLGQRQGKEGQGFQCRGSKTYTFKTIFGTVPIHRRRIQYKADGQVVVPSAQAWQTPPQVCITAGLRAAVCDGLRQQSARQTVERLAERAGEEGLLGRSEVVELVHDEGQRLQAAQEQRATTVWAQDAEAVRVLLPAVSLADQSLAEAEAQAEAAAELAVVAPEVSVAVETPPATPPLGFPGSLAAAEAVAADQPRQVDPHCVLVEADEVKVHAQARSGQKALLVYTAVVLTAAATWHVSAATAEALQRQVGSLLAVLGVHRGERQLLFLADGARWIRNWFSGLLLTGKAMILCWYHLVKHCEQSLSMACRGRAHREEVQEQVLGHLWHGRVEDALEVLRQRRGEMKNEAALEGLLGYLEQRREYIPDYGARREAGLWIASNRVEKFNDWAVSERCKHQGMSWTAAGVNALASLEAAQRNGELDYWRQSKCLPAWEVPEDNRKVA
jgi:hypothetical protein